MRQEDEAGGPQDTGKAQEPEGSAEKAGSKKDKYQKAQAKAEHAGEKLGKAREKLDKTEAKRAAKKPPGLAKKAVRGARTEAWFYVHNKIHEVEHENVGVEGAHKSELAAEAGTRKLTRYAKRRWQEHPARKVAKWERKDIKARANVDFQKMASEHPELASNPLSRVQQKWKLKRRYSKEAKAAAKQGAKAAKKTAAASGTATRRAAQFVTRHPVAVLVLLLLLLLCFLVSAVSSIFPTLGSGLANALSGTSYASEDIRDCLDYGKDPKKTESGKYISAYECDPATVADEFLLAKASYAAMTGREQKKENNVLCYQIRQSFYPGEITPKEANRIGYELAMRWTKGRHAFIVTTHTDKQHIHCHIYYNSTTLDCTRKFRNFWGSSFALRRLSDRLCLENGLSIVENPKPRSKSKYRNYGEWQKDRKGPLSYQDRLRLAIDTALAERPADLDEFLNLMKRAGYEVKTVRGGGISFRLTGQGQERFTRLRASTLGDGYDLQDVLSAIEGKEKRPGRSERKISLAVDIQAKLAAGKGPGYERWAKVFNIKQMAAALAYIQDNNLTDYEQLAKKATEAADRFHAISEQIKQTEQAMKTNAGLKAATVQYAKTRPVFEQYKATKYSRKFLAEHEADLELYRAAQAEMRSLLGGAKLPKMDVLKEEGRKLTAKKKQLYGEYQKARRDMQEIVTIKANIDTLMGYTEPGRKQEKER